MSAIFSNARMNEAFERILGHDAPAADELQGRLAGAEAEKLEHPDEPPSQNEIDGAISAILLQASFTPDEYLCIVASSNSERGGAYLELRTTLAHVLVMPTPANHEAVARAAMRCVRLSLLEHALDHLQLGPHP